MICKYNKEFTCLWNYVIKKELGKHSYTDSLSPKIKPHIITCKILDKSSVARFPANKFAGAHADYWYISIKCTWPFGIGYTTNCSVWTWTHQLRVLVLCPTNRGLSLSCVKLPLLLLDKNGNCITPYQKWNFINNTHNSENGKDDHSNSNATTATASIENCHHRTMDTKSRL